MGIIYKSTQILNYRSSVISCGLWVPETPIGRYAKNFSLVGKTFSLFFIRGNCHKVADPLGRCSLDLDGLEDLVDHSKDDKNNPKHCPYIYHLIQTEPDNMFPKHNSRNKVGNKQSPINLYKFKCGHYSTGQGQHRICISGTLGLSLPRVRLSYLLHKDCDSCSEPRSATRLFSF